jgi:large subunit ribosomal protein L23
MAKKVAEKNIAGPKSVLRGIRMTEKAVLASESRGMYAFNVTPDATKAQVTASVKAAHKVTPVKVRLVAIPTKKVFVRGKWGVRGGGKKAYVYLKKGDKIDA